MRILLLTAASALALTAIVPASHAQTSEIETPAKEDINSQLSAFSKIMTIRNSPIPRSQKPIAASGIPIMANGMILAMPLKSHDMNGVRRRWHGWKQSLTPLN